MFIVVVLFAATRLPAFFVGGLATTSQESLDFYRLVMVLATGLSIRNAARQGCEANVKG